MAHCAHRIMAESARFPTQTGFNFDSAGKVLASWLTPAGPMSALEPEAGRRPAGQGWSESHEGKIP